MSTFIFEGETVYPVSGYEDRIGITKTGKIYSSGSNSWKPGWRKISKDRYGYQKISIWKDGKLKSHTVHRLVATTFIPNTFNFPQINHKDLDKTNNNVTNLEWVTDSDNKLHAKLHRLKREYAKK